MKDRKRKNAKSSKITRRVVRILGYIVVYTLLVWMTMWGCRKAYTFCYEVFGSVSVQQEPGTEVAFQVEAADNMKSVSEKLEREKIIVNKYSFQARVRLLNDPDNALKPGIYMLNTSMDYQEILDQLMVTEGISE